MDSIDLRRTPQLTESCKGSWHPLRRFSKISPHDRADVWMAITCPGPMAPSPATARRWKAAKHRELNPPEARSREALVASPAAEAGRLRAPRGETHLRLPLDLTLGGYPLCWHDLRPWCGC